MLGKLRLCHSIFDFRKKLFCDSALSAPLTRTESDSLLGYTERNQTPSCVGFGSHCRADSIKVCRDDICTPRRHLCDRISRRNRSWIRNYFSLFIRGDYLRGVQHTAEMISVHTTEAISAVCNPWSPRCATYRGDKLHTAESKSKSSLDYDYF